MSDNESDLGEADDQLDSLAVAKDEAINRCQYRTAIRLAAEIKRKAKAARRLKPYVWALHTMTNHATSLLDPEQGREAAIELIAVMESEDLARQIQPDLDLAEYESLVSWVSSCAYDNLGQSTAASRGYNSEGLHDVIAEGIQVCRRTGKLQCITCFREYATEVFRASDDLQMSLHHARQVVATGRSNPAFDRRWAGSSDEGQTLLVAGLLDAAEAATRRAWDLAATYHSPVRARLWTAQVLETIGFLKGLEEPLSGLEGIDELRRSMPSADEWPLLKLRRDLVSALRSCLRGDHATAIQALALWDRRLQERQCLNDWFDVRLRLIAAYLLAGDEKRGDGLARQLESKAREARDWLTLRRLGLLLDPSVPVSPIAPAGPIVGGASSATAAAPAAPESREEESHSAPEPSPGRAPTPLGPKLDEIEARLGEASDDPALRGRLLDALLALAPAAATHSADVARMLALARVFHDDPSRGPSIWDWAEAIAAPFPREACVLNQLASMGARLKHDENSQVADRIDAKRIDQLFRQSLDLDPNDFGNFGRAAIHYLNSEQTNEAERCLARCLRLDRSNARASLWLAEIYRQSERSSDALAVLDMALRAGSDSHEVAWQAGILAHSLASYEAMLTYLDYYESPLPGRPWANYYRASGLIFLGRHAEALEALDEEARRNEAGSFHVHVLRACASSGLGRLEDLRTHLAAVLSIRMSGVDYLSHGGLVELFSRLWDAAKVLPDDDLLVVGLIDRSLATGLAPNELFDPTRRSNPKVEGLKFYECTLIQKLDDGWRNSPGCLAGEADWTAYHIPWGVLATDEDDAGRRALAWQARCYPREAVVEDVQLREEGFTDHPGVVWQGLRSPQE